MRRVVPCFCLVRLTGATPIPHFKRKIQIGDVEYWNTGCGESRRSGVDAGNERKLLPMAYYMDYSDHCVLGAGISSSST